MELYGTGGVSLWEYVELLSSLAGVWQLKDPHGFHKALTSTKVGVLYGQWPNKRYTVETPLLKKKGVFFFLGGGSKFRIILNESYPKTYV